jgi:hypothetical protein
MHVIFSDIEAGDVTDLVQEALIRYGLVPGGTDIRVGASDGTTPDSLPQC